MRRVGPNSFTEIYFAGCNPSYIETSDGYVMIDSPQQPIDAVRWRERLLPWAFETAGAIAANSPSAVQAVRQQISASIADYARSREALEQELGDRVRSSPHFAEGIAAFREKRKPDYS